MAGFPTTKTDIDARVGSLVASLRDTLDQADRINTWFLGVTDADLQARGYSTEDVAVMKSAFASLAALRKVAYGQQAQPTADDFFFWGRKLTGLL